MEDWTGKLPASIILYLSINNGRSDVDFPLRPKRNKAFAFEVLLWGLNPFYPDEFSSREFLEDRNVNSSKEAAMSHMRILAVQFLRKMWVR